MLKIYLAEIFGTWKGKNDLPLPTFKTILCLLGVLFHFVTPGSHLHDT